MVEVGSREFHTLSMKLADQLVGQLESFAEKHGTTFDLDSLRRQSGQEMESVIHDLLMHGMNVYAAEQEEEEDRPDNVIPFSRRLVALLRGRSPEGPSRPQRQLSSH